MNNPYAVGASREDANASEGKWLVSTPSAVLVLLALLTILLESWLVAFPTIYFLTTTIRDTPHFSVAMISGWGFIAFGLLVFASHWVILIGSICMWRNRSRKFAELAAVLSIVPVLSPLYVMGVPFGIWGLIALIRSRRPPAAANTMGRMADRALAVWSRCNCIPESE